MNTYENLIKRAKRYRAGLRTESLSLMIMPVLVVVIFLMKMAAVGKLDTLDILETVIAFAFTILLVWGTLFVIRIVDGKDSSPKTVEFDFEGMRVEAGAPDGESFSEMLDQMDCYENFIYLDHRYLLDFRSVHVVHVRNILKVDGITTYDRFGRHHQRRNRYFVMVFADEALKIPCKNHRSQEELLRALNLAIMEKDHMIQKAASAPKANWNTIQTSGDAEMDELNLDH